MNIGFRSAIGQMGHTVSAELISRSWKEARPDYTLNNRGRGAWLQAAWGRRRPADSVLEPHVPAGGAQQAAIAIGGCAGCVVFELNHGEFVYV